MSSGEFNTYSRPFVRVLFTDNVFFYSEEGQRLLSSQAQEESEDEEVLFNAPIGERTTPSSVPPASSGPGSVSVEPPPSYSNNQQPATLAPITLSSQPSNPPRNPPHGVPSFPMTTAAAGASALNEKPPDYSLHPPQGGNYPGKAGMAVHIQIDGRLVPGTIMEDVRLFSALLASWFTGVLCTGSLFTDGLWKL